MANVGKAGLNGRPSPLASVQVWEARRGLNRKSSRRGGMDERRNVGMSSPDTRDAGRRTARRLGTSRKG